jgi:hypothetical protein
MTLVVRGHYPSLATASIVGSRAAKLPYGALVSIEVVAYRGRKL